MTDASARRPVGKPAAVAESYVSVTVLFGITVIWIALKGYKSVVLTAGFGVRDEV
jgi:hypothetical protein